MQTPSICLLPEQTLFRTQCVPLLRTISYMQQHLLDFGFSENFKGQVFAHQPLQISLTQNIYLSAANNLTSSFS